MAGSLSLTGYGPRRTLIFAGDENKYELWEVKFLGYARLQKLYNVFVPAADEREAPTAAKNAEAFAELVQCLDDRSLALVIREARDDGRRALQVLREHYQGKGKPRIIALYTELTSLEMREGESTTDYILRAEKAATALKAADEVISDGLLVAMALKGLPSGYKTFATVVTQKETQMTFSEFKTALRNHEETEKSCNRAPNNDESDNVMATWQGFQGNCFKCGKKGHRSKDCYSKEKKWCHKCKNSTHSTRDCRKVKPAKDAANKSAEKKENIVSSHSFVFTFNEQELSTRGKTTPNLLLDTGATSHIIVDRDKFVNFDEKFNASSHFIELADGSKANVCLGRGNARVKLYDVNGKLRDVVLDNALYIPSYKQNIFSVSAAIAKGASVSLDREGKYFKAPDGTMFGIEQKGRLYYLNSISSSKTNASSLMEWHKIMGHCNFQDLRKLQNVVDGMKIADEQQCECAICTQGKLCQTRSRKPDERAKSPLEFVHCDLAGPIDPVARDGFKYALCFVDDYTSINMVYFLKQKSDTVEATQKFLADIAPFGKIKRIRSDNGTEFKSNQFQSLLRKNLIKHETSAPYSPHQNGTVERMWRSLFEMARCLLLESELPKSLWTYAVMTAAYIKNRCFNSRLGKTPYEALIGKRPDLSNMHIFGSTCFAYVQNAKKLEARSKEGVFVGYDKGSPAYLVYYPEANKVERVRCVKFLEQNVCVPKIENDEILSPTPLTTVDTDVGDEQTTEDRDAVDVSENEDSGEDSRYPKRIHNKPKHLDEYVLDGDLEDDVNYTVDYCYRVANIPTTYNDALKSNEATKWQNAMRDEMTALHDNWPCFHERFFRSLSE